MFLYQTHYLPLSKHASPTHQTNPVSYLCMPLTTATAFAAAAVGSAAARRQHARHRSRFFHPRTQHHIVPVDSTLHETSVMRTFAQGLRRHIRDLVPFCKMHFCIHTVNFNVLRPCEVFTI